MKINKIKFAKLLSMAVGKRIQKTDVTLVFFIRYENKHGQMYRYTE